MQIDDSAVEILVDKGFDPVYGARPLKRTIQSNLEDAISEILLDSEDSAEIVLFVKGEDDELKIEVKSHDQAICSEKSEMAPISTCVAADG